MIIFGHVAKRQQRQSGVRGKLSGIWGGGGKGPTKSLPVFLQVQWTKKPENSIDIILTFVMGITINSADVKN